MCLNIMLIFLSIMDLLKNLQEGDDEKRSLQARPGSVNEISGACESHTYSCAQKHLCARLFFLLNSAVAGAKISRPVAKLTMWTLYMFIQCIIPNIQCIYDINKVKIHY